LAKFNQPRFWRTIEKHPLNKEKNWSPIMKATIQERLKEHGIVGGRKITLHEDQIIDGWQLYSSCVELDIHPEFAPMPKGIDPETFVEITNLRRHESEEQITERAKERRERVAAAKAAGQSNRAIAEWEGVAESTVRNDLEELAGAQGCAPEPPDGKVTGRDGKKQAAKKAPTSPPPSSMCERCTRVGPVKDCQACESLGNPAKKEEPEKPRKSGSTKFDEKLIETTYGPLVRIIDKRATLMGKCPTPRGPAAKADQDDLRARLSKVTQETTRHGRCQEILSVLLEELKLWRKEG
jgi:hypothetical protein